MQNPLEQYAHLDEKSAALYMALLRIGEMPIAGLVRAGGVKRSTVYLHIEELARRGLVEKVVRGKRLYYRAANPKKLLSSVEQEHKELKRYLPELFALYESRHKEPVVRVFSGKAGLSDVYRIVESEALWVKTMFAPKSFYTVFSEAESTAFAENLEDSGVKMQSLLFNDSESRKLIHRESAFSHKLKLLPKEMPLTINILLWSNSVALISYEHLYGLIIENQSIAKHHENQFNILWGKGA